MKLARQYMVEINQPQRCKFIARKGGFHGTTLGALSVTEKVAIRKPFEPLLNTDNVSYVSTPNMYRGIRDGETEEAYVNRLAKELEDEFQRIGPQTVCAFIAETFTGSVNKPQDVQTHCASADMIFLVTRLPWSTTRIF